MASSARSIAISPPARPWPAKVSTPISSSTTRPSIRAIRGPLFDLAGRVVGVNTLGIPQSGVTPVQGLFFAIPANRVADIASQLIENGEVSYPYIGVEYQPITPDLAAQNDLPVDYGAYVLATVQGGPADQGGIRRGDIILGIGDERIQGQTTFTEALFAQAPGDTVPVMVLRGNEEVQIEVTLAARQVN